MIAVYGADYVMCMNGEHGAVLKVTNDSVHSLESSGDARCLLGICERAEVFCKGERLLCCLEYDAPNRAKLKRLYEKFGFFAIGETLERKMI